MNYRQQIEDGKPTTSFNNLIGFSASHGPPLGAIHRIDPLGNQTTDFYFMDQSILKVFGFYLEEPSDELKMMNILAFKMALSLIPGLINLIEGDAILKILSVAQETIQAEKTATIFWIAPSHYLPSDNPLLNSDGLAVLQETIDWIATEDEAELISGDCSMYETEES